MHIALFGASGNLGKILQAQLVAGNHVNAFIRHKDDAIRSDVKYFIGDTLAPTAVLKTIDGCDAVIDVIGGAENSTTRSQVVTEIVKMMQTRHISRIIAMGGSGILSVGPFKFGQLPIFPRDKKAVTKEHERVHQVLLKSELRWTQVCPSYMTDGNATGKYRIKVGHPFLLWKQSVRLIDVADFIVSELKNNEYVAKQVMLIN